MKQSGWEEILGNGNKKRQKMEREIEETRHEK
jgi:hypothetical protein